MVNVAECQEALKDKSNPKLFLDLCQKFVDDMTVFILVEKEKHSDFEKHIYLNNNGKTIAVGTKVYHWGRTFIFVGVDDPFRGYDHKEMQPKEVDSYIVSKLTSLGYVMSTDPPAERV